MPFCHTHEHADTGIANVGATVVSPISTDATMPRSSSPTLSMVEQIARDIATADGARFEDDRARFRKLALAALKPLARPTEPRDRRQGDSCNAGHIPS